jgi:cytochrome c-type biogenesis protein CcmE
MTELAAQPVTVRPSGGRTKFWVGGLMLLAAVAYLIISGITNQNEYYITIDKLIANPDRYLERDARVIGVVIGDTIQYDGHTLTFDIAYIPDSAAEIEDEGGLAEVLHQAVSNPDAERITVRVVDQPKPDLLKHEAQAIVTGQLVQQADGTYLFEANELLLKCPTRYEEAVPDAGG